MSSLLRSLAFFFFTTRAICQWVTPNPVVDFRKESDGVTLTMQKGTTRIRALSDSMIHVTYSPVASFPSRPDYVVINTARTFHGAAPNQPLRILFWRLAG